MVRCFLSRPRTPLGQNSFWQCLVAAGSLLRRRGSGRAGWLAAVPVQSKSSQHNHSSIKTLGNIKLRLWPVSTRQWPPIEPIAAYNYCCAAQLAVTATRAQMILTANGSTPAVCTALLLTVLNAAALTQSPRATIRTQRATARTRLAATPRYTGDSFPSDLAATDRVQ